MRRHADFGKRRGLRQSTGRISLIRERGCACVLITWALQFRRGCPITGWRQHAGARLHGGALETPATMPADYHGLHDPRRGAQNRQKLAGFSSQCRLMAFLMGFFKKIIKDLLPSEWVVLA